MTRILSVDPGENTGIALMHYDALTPLRLERRWQVHNGLNGFIGWARQNGDIIATVDEWLVEKFIFDPNADAADLSGVPIEGVIGWLADQHDVPVIWQSRMDKSGLIGYPESAKTKALRQRARFDFLDRIGMFRPGEEYTDSNDAIVHALVSLKRRKHRPTLNYWKGASIAR